MSATKKKLTELAKSHRRTKITLVILIITEVAWLGFILYGVVKEAMRTTEYQIPAETYEEE